MKSEEKNLQHSLNHPNDNMHRSLEVSVTSLSVSGMPLYKARVCPNMKSTAQFKPPKWQHAQKSLEVSVTSLSVSGMPLYKAWVCPTYFNLGLCLSLSWGNSGCVWFSRGPNWFPLRWPIGPRDLLPLKKTCASLYRPGVGVICGGWIYMFCCCCMNICRWFIMFICIHCGGAAWWKKPWLPWFQKGSMVPDLLSASCACGGRCCGPATESGKTLLLLLVSNWLWPKHWFERMRAAQLLLQSFQSAVGMKNAPGRRSPDDRRVGTRHSCSTVEGRSKSVNNEVVAWGPERWRARCVDSIDWLNLKIAQGTAIRINNNNK